MKLQLFPLWPVQKTLEILKTFGFCARAMTLLLVLLSFFAQSQVYVAINGNDANEGTKEMPFSTVHVAVRKVREMRRLHDASIAKGATIYVGGGLYRFDEPLFIRPEDAGTAQSPTTIEAMPNERPVFSGGLNVQGWKKVGGNISCLPQKAQGKIWVAEAPIVGGEPFNFRQLWVNDKKAVRARSTGADSMSRILSWNKKEQSCWIPKPVADISNVKGVEMFIQQWWAIAILRVKSITTQGDSALLTFQQPESRIQSEHPWPAPWISAETGNSPFYLTNALQFLNTPGEWYLDRREHKLYYWPRTGEDMNTASVVAPALETLVRIEGTAERPVSNVGFKGISFQHTTWLRPSQKGHVPLQAGMYLLDAYKLKTPGTTDKASLENQAWAGRPPSAVEVFSASNVAFMACRFEHTASTALDFVKGVKESRIEGNLFKDIGGTAILAGTFSDEATEAHLPYNPTDEREVTESLDIASNLVNNAANEDWGCVGIGAGFLRNSFIRRNDLSDLPYTGISLGWGWTKTASVLQNNVVAANKIQRYGQRLYDCAAIYTLGAQPKTHINVNYIDSIYKAPQPHLPAHWFYLYTDEGTAGVTVKDNWTPSQKFLQNANGLDNVWTNNGAMVSESVKAAAGLLPEFSCLLKEKNAYDGAFPVNHELPVIIELTAASDEVIDVQKMKTVLKEAGADAVAPYRWNNHVAIFGKVQDVSVLRSRLQKAFPSLQTKVYDDAFYEFNRERCGDTSTAREWDHVLLTANLVADPKLQREYLNYHATQAQAWPQVAKGFCNAGFQQLLLYKNGRQLMLVISIPKGESLDKLNPKTTENNPQMIEWNKRMARYQQGIEGTKPGETWVFLQAMNTN